EVDIAKVLDHTLDHYGRDISARIDWKKWTVPVIVLGSSELRMIFIDLLVNADCAMKGQDDGCIRVNLRTELKTPSVVITFEDNGPGVPEGIQERLFEPYVSGTN